MFARTLDEHRKAVETLLAPLAAELDARPQLVGVHDPEAFDRVLVRHVTALVPVPTFDNSQMDGYAVCAEDLAGASAGHPVTLPIGVTTAAGDAPVAHVRGTASPVMTGAAIPVGADAVVPVEDTIGSTVSSTDSDTVSDTVSGTVAEQFPQQFPQLMRLGEGEPVGEVAFTTPVDAGTFVRRRAEDLEVGATVLRAGTRLTPSRIGATAAVGVTDVEVRPRLRVLLCTTGDEVQGIGKSPEATESSEPNEKLRTYETAGTYETLGAYENSGSGAPTGNGEAAGLRPGQICDANTPMLHAALHGLGAEVEILRSGDNPDEFREALLASVDECDLIITTGGISRGAYEVVRSALGPLGVEFGTVAIQPGGPQGLGFIPKNPSEAAAEAVAWETTGGRETTGGGKTTGGEETTGGGAGRATGGNSKASNVVPILCFPGNPVSAVLSFELFLAPILRELSGLPAERPGVELLLAHDVVSPQHKHQLRRGMIDAEGNVVVFGPGSHLIGDLADADVLVHVPVATTSAGAGTPVHTWRFND